MEAIPIASGDAVQATSSEDSLKKRYLAKLAKGVTDAGINVALLLFVPRVLGPGSYGSFNFVRDTFQNTINLADLNLSSAHINRASRKGDSSAATDVYLSYTLLIGVLLFGGVAAITLTGLGRYIFPGQVSTVLFLGALLAYLMYLYVALMGLSDSKVATYGFELRSIAVNVGMSVPLVLLYWGNALNLTTFFTLRIVLYMALLGVGAHYLSRTIRFHPRLANPWDPNTQEVIRTFLSYSHPLVTMSLLGVLFSFFDRWLLQVVYGSVSQGYFSLAFSLTSVASLCLAPMTPLLMQSVARSDEANDAAGVRTAFRRVELLYLVSAFISVFVMFHSAEIIRLIGGHEYDGAQATIVVMFVYPIHVVYGQFCGGTLIALRKTGLYRNISLVSSLVGVVLTYVLLAPRSFTIPGLELNSLGLALKLVLVQLVSVSLQLYFVCRQLNEPMSRFIFTQVMTPLPIIAIGLGEWLVRSGLGFQTSGVVDSLLSVIGSLAVWALVVGATLWRYPALAGLEKSVLRGAARDVYLGVRSKFQGVSS